MVIHNELDTRVSLNEIQLTKELGVSRTPIREAMIMLEMEGLLTRLEHTRGFFVKQFSLKEVHDLYELRLIIEMASASKIIDNITNRDLEILQDVLDSVDDLIDQKRPDEALVRAIDFHLHTIQICTVNSFLVDALRNCYEKLIVISWICQSTDACIRSAQEHKRIFEAIKTRNLTDFCMWNEQHTQGARDRMMNLLRVDPEKLYFMP